MSLINKLLAARLEQQCRWQEKDAITYALATGFGRDELERQELAYIFEGRGLTVSPGFATMLPEFPFPAMAEIDFEQSSLHACELEIFSPLLPEDDIVIHSDVLAAGRHAEQDRLITSARSQASRLSDNRALFSFVRSYQAAAVQTEQSWPVVDLAAAPVLPKRPADFQELIELREDQSAIFRLCGDWRARSVDADQARRSGFAKPVLPSLCLLGCVARMVLATVCDYDPTLVRKIVAVFAGHASGGDTLMLNMWQDGPVIRFSVNMHADQRLLSAGEFVLTA